MNRLTRRSILAAAPAAALALRAWPARAKNYGPGVTDTEIKIGNTVPYSGPASSYGTIGKAQAAFWKMINEQGGINGRKINFISYDDGYTPPKTLEMIRKLVEQDEVLCTSATLGTPTNSAIWQYMNQKKVPQLFVATGATKWNDPKGHPWTIGWQPNYQSEGHVYAAYILREKPNGKIGVLYQNDDFGKDYLKGLKDGLGGRMQVVAEAPYEVSDPTVDSQLVLLKASAADVFFNEASPKFAAQAIRKAAELDWKPIHLLASISNSVGSVLKPAGVDNAKGIMSAAYLKDPTDPAWRNDPATKEWEAFMDKYLHLL
jgi:branched-chain amino acid transport system substrate-binding protein